MKKIRIALILNDLETASIELPIEDRFNKKAVFDFVESAINSKFNYEHISIGFQKCVIVTPCNYYFFPLLEAAINKAFSPGE